jgi:GNAT superfamily N-acetyltransferase
MPITKFSIRKAKPRDVSGMMNLIRELAVYERAGDEVHIDEEDLRRDGFENQAYSAFVAELNNEVAGMALYYPKYSTWKGRCIYLEDLVVAEHYRGQGIGRALFAALVNEAKAFGAARLEWQVLDWNAPAISFYKSLNAELDGEWINCRLTREQIESFNRDTE